MYYEPFLKKIIKFSKHRDFLSYNMLISTYESK
jgi:hypothetical protein